ncbi:MAG: transposase, partial [Chloroflexi bacterium]|nr:transposase [Chloroflexota bacterium]
YNGRFTVPAAQPGDAYRPLPTEVELDAVLCFEYDRTVAMDNTVSLGGKELQITPDQVRSSYARTTVTVQERLDGRVVVLHQGRELTSTDAPPFP